MNEKLKFPIGKFEWIEEPNSTQIESAFQVLSNFPQRLKEALAGTTEKDLLKHYRTEGWNIAQVVHHLADSHLHSYLRMKHAVLEIQPHIKDYNEADWATLPDATNTEISYSLELLNALHKRWTVFLKQLDTEQLKRSYFHPERNKFYPVGTTILLYAWHCEHHLEHIKIALAN